MSVTNFCCCCDLRRGCVVFAWLQMMCLIMAIVTLFGYSDYFTLIAISYNKSNYYTQSDIAASFSLVSKIISGLLFIKIATCISLIWGVIKKIHLFYQPWLFISGIDVCVSSLSVLVFFILGCIVSPTFLLAFFVHGCLTALNWYFWICVYTVYKKDMKPSMLSFEMGYDQYSNDHYTNPATEM